jgi:N-acetylglucosaminyl-diphospho-decaprenol L-rhamnosyltransferase
VTEVRVGIVSWNTADLLGRCLDLLPAALGDLDAEVVVVDNASQDGSAEVGDARQGVRVIRNADNVGYARAMNQALAGSSATTLIALNPDTLPPSGSLSALVAYLDARPEVGLVAPRLVEADGAWQHSVYRFPSIRVALLVSFLPVRLQRGWIGRRWWLEAAAPHAGAGDIDWAIGAVHVIRAAAVGPEVYSERWFMYVEDLELCWRLRSTGWRVHLDPDVAVPHVGNASGSQAWGDTRAQRYWGASYDFDQSTRGPAHTRAWAAVNTAGVAARLAVSAIGSVRQGEDGARRRRVAAELRRILPVHLGVVFRGPPPLAGGVTTGTGVPSPRPPSC